MVGSLNKTFLFLGGTLFLLFIPWVESAYLPIYAVNIATFLFYILVINGSFRLKYFGNKELVVIVLLYGLLFVSLYNMISYGYRGNFFLFSEVDAGTYDRFARTMAGMPFLESIDYYLLYYGFSDLGAVTILRTLYLLADSNLLYNFYNLLIGTATAFVMFRIGRKIMSREYAFVCSLTFSLSSYMLWFHASGLKESTMILLTVLFYDQLYMYSKTKKKRTILYAVLIASAFIFYRPAITVFFIGSVGISAIFTRIKGYKKVVLIITIALLTVISFAFIEEIFNRFLMGGDIKLLIATKIATGMVIGSIPLTYSVNIIAQLMGPLPTIISTETYLSFFSSGLIFRVLIAFPFWVGAFYIVKRRNEYLYPLLIFIFLEMFSLALILEGLELRKSMIHLPLVYLIAFWFMNLYKIGLIRKKLIVKIGFSIYSIATLFFLIIWNFR